ncbi:MAG: hypothetical protein ACHQNA_03680 [Acidimicrobiales bacterium]
MTGTPGTPGTPARRGTETGAAFGRLLEEVRGLEAKLHEGPNAPTDEQSVLEGYKWIFSILQVALDVHVWADPANPRFVDIVGPYKKWGGDNADAAYQFAPIDPTRTYRVRCRPGDCVYLSLTVYGGPRDGHYSTRIVGAVNDRDARPGPEGTFEIILSAEPHEGLWIKLEPDSVAAITRDYVIDPVHDRPASWHITADDRPATWRESDAELANRMTAALTWVRDQAAMVPLALGVPNTVDDPYPVPAQTFGWAAGDAAYAMGSFDLAPDQALIIRGRSPECAFWNLCLWNQFLHTYNYDYERVTINGGQVAFEPDRSWVIVVSAGDPGHPNWVSTAGHPRGRLWFRWFYPDHTPDRPTTEVVDLRAVRR